MDTTFQKILKQIDSRTDCLVHGYFKAQFHHQNNLEVIIPHLIIYTTLAFYWIREYFSDINPEQITASEDGLCIKVQKTPILSELEMMLIFW